MEVSEVDDMAAVWMVDRESSGVRSGLRIDFIELWS